MTARHWILASALVIGALAAGRYSQPERESARVHEREVIRVPVAGQSGTYAAIDREVLRDELRAVVGELHGAAPAPVAAPEPTPDQDRAGEQGRAVVAAAVTRRRWTAADGEQLRASLVAMTREQRMATLSSLTKAINRGELVPDDVVLF
jgi:hypothetical protein